MNVSGNENHVAWCQTANLMLRGSIPPADSVSNILIQSFCEKLVFTERDMMKVLVLTETEYDECQYDECSSRTEVVGTFIVEDDFDLDANYKLWDQETGVRKSGKNQHGSWTSKWSVDHSKKFHDWLSEKLTKIEHIEWNV